MANILVVDDSMLERKVLADIMTTLGHDIIGQAKNGEQAIEEYMRLKPDLVTMDLTMGGIDGSEAISQIIAADPDARIVVVSSHQEGQIILDALERGARHFLIKPLSLERVSEILTNMLHQPFDKDKQQELISRIKKNVCAQEKTPKQHLARILIADDSAFARQMLRDIVTALGHVVVSEATNGTQAFVEYTRTKPDLMTIDLTMQGLEGAETISKIIAIHPDARIIVVSAIESRAAIIDALERGARHFIVKPIRQEKVAAAIETVLQQNLNPQKYLDGIRKLKSNEDIQVFAEAAAKYVAPYTIKIQNDHYIHVFIDQTLTSTSCQTLMTELGEYLDDKPRLLLNFGSMSNLDPQLFDQFNKLVQTLEENSGFVRAISNNEDFVNNITNLEFENTPNMLAEVLKYSKT